MAKGHETAGEELKPAEHAISMTRTYSAKQNEKHYGQDVRDKETDDGGRHEGYKNRIGLSPLHRIKAIHG